MPRTPARIDLGDEFPDTSEDEVDTVSVGPIFGRDWKVLRDLNIYTALQADTGDAEGYYKIIANAIHPDDRQAFLSKLGQQRRFDAPKMLNLVQRLLEAAAGEVPTQSSSGSSAGTRKKAAARPSAAR